MGGNIEKFQLSNGKYVWSITSTSYVQGDINTSQRLLEKYGSTLKTGKRPQKFPLTHRYKPGLDTTDECDADHTSRYQQSIGILLRDAEIERIDIQLEVALMSQYWMSPREGYLEALYLIFQFMWKNTNKRQVMDPSNPMIYESVFHFNVDWVEFYGDVAEEYPPRMLESLGDPMSTSTFVDSENA